jgi:intron-binding protein aquarius
VATVDKYQGQQNEYVLLSLVRTRAVGHVRDVRRLVVAMSRARLGLYVFGRLPLFANCYELQPTMQHLLERPTHLALHPTEYLQVWTPSLSLMACLDKMPTVSNTLKVVIILLPARTVPCQVRSKIDVLKMSRV